MAWGGSCQPVSLAGASALLRYISTLPDWQLGPDFGKLSDNPIAQGALQGVG
jgi:hypothetical protein